MPFDPEEFLESEISISSVSGLLKAELVLLAKILNIEFDSQAKKAIIKDLIVDGLIDSDHFNLLHFDYNLTLIFRLSKLANNIVNLV